MNMSTMNMPAIDMGSDNDNMSHSTNNNQSNTIMTNMDMDHGSSDSSMAKMTHDTANNSTVNSKYNRISNS